MSATDLELASATERLNELRGLYRPRAVPLSEEPLVPGLRFRLDPEAGFEGVWHSPRGRLVSLQARPERPGRWLGLHLELGPLPLENVQFLGVVARLAAPRPAAIRMALRSGREDGGFSDQFFQRHLLAQPGEADHLDMISPDRMPDIPATAPWRELVLFFPPTEHLEVSLHDLRIFAP